MHVSHSAPPGQLRHYQSYPRPQHSRYPEHNYHEQQRQYEQYEQYEQQSRYYREVNASAQHPNTQEYQHQQQQGYYGPPYQHSTYHSAYASVSQSPRSQQLQPQRSLNLGSMHQNRFAIPRDQLPTAPSPSVFSATQPAPIFPEPSATTQLPTANPDAPTLSLPKPSESLFATEPATFITEEQVSQHPNRASTYSTFPLGSPVMSEKVARPMSALQGSTTQFVMSPIRSGHHSASTAPLCNLAKSGSDLHWSAASNSLIAQTKARAAQAHSYSRQITLSAIPANEEVPPMPGKMASKSGKVRIQLIFDRPFFNAGGELSGRLEIQCSSSRSVMLADMVIELLGYEALTKDHLAPKVFHKTVLRLQDMHHPSQAVQENIDADAEGYWMARKGRTIFPFRLNIQDTLPNSYDSKLGQVRYVASAIALTKTHHHKETVNHTREVFIYETWTTDDITQARRKSVKADTSKRLFMGGEGSLEMYAELTRTMVSSGGIVYVNVGVKNLTKKKIMGIKLSLWRHIAVSNKRSSISNQSSMMGVRDQDSVKNYSEIIYKGEDYAFGNDDSRVVVLPVYIPSGVYSLRNTTHLHVQFFVQVSLMASMSKALTVELPIYITHASSWSDPPPRIPKDFAFPMHEDEPVKKNKTGVFSKKKTSATPSQSVGPSASTKISPTFSASSSSVATSTSTYSGKPTTEGPPSATSASRPITRRSPLKDPDSPTSVLDFSQAGNLFVVNPDTNSTLAASDIASTAKLHPVNYSALLPSAPPSVSTSPLDRSPTPLMLSEHASFSSSGTDKPEAASQTRHGSVQAPTVQDANEEQDFDMTRSVGTSQPNSIRAEASKSKPGKLGLRKTLARLSIAIPSHTSNATPVNKISVSPRMLPTTPRSGKSVTMDSPEEAASPAGSMSSGGARSLSRQSSGSSLESFKHVFDSKSRKSSIGSTRVMTVSPGPMSPNLGMLKMTRCASSNPGSPVLSATNSTPSSAPASRIPSRASSPTSQSGTSSIEAQGKRVFRECRHETDQLNMTPSVPDALFHYDTPAVEGIGPEGCVKPSGSRNRSSTSSPSRNQVTIALSSPATVNSFVKPWENQSNISSSTINSFTLDSHEDVQTAKAIRDEYYLDQDARSRNVSTEASLSTQESQSQKQVAYGSWGQSRESSVSQDGSMQHAWGSSQYENHDDAHLVTCAHTTALMASVVASSESYASQKEHPVQNRDLASAQSSELESGSSSIQFPQDQQGADSKILVPEGPRISQIQYGRQPCPASPMTRAVLSRNASIEDARMYSGPEFPLVSQIGSPYLDSESRMHEQALVQPDEPCSPEVYLTPEIFCTPTLPHIEPTHVDPVCDHRSSSCVTGPRPMTPLSSSTSFQSDQLRLAPGNTDVGKQLDGIPGRSTPIGQSYNPQRSEACDSIKAAQVHQDNLQNAILHSTRSNSRQTSAEQWCSEAITMQQESQQQESQQQETPNIYHVDQRYPCQLEDERIRSGGYEEVVTYAVPDMAPLPSRTFQPSSSHVSVHQSEKDRISYQHRTQHRQAANLPPSTVSPMPITDANSSGIKYNETGIQGAQLENGFDSSTSGLSSSSSPAIHNRP
ncbi:hypothetical protein BGZ54_004632 [Gamsiella multidivaricata]|nr:hypothetical protein BGZ54_004632 [Gamsiella multidivaricata]